MLVVKKRGQNTGKNNSLSEKERRPWEKA